MIRAGLAVSAAAIAAALTLSGCSTATAAADQDSRPAVSVRPANGTLQTDASPDRILIGWGQIFDDTELTTPDAAQVSATCTGTGNDLRVKLTAPAGWTIYMTAHSPKLHVVNTNQHLDAELDATPKIPGMPVPITWTDTSVDLAASAYVPDEWNSRYGPGQQFYIAAHIDCATK